MKNIFSNILHPKTHKQENYNSVHESMLNELIEERNQWIAKKKEAIDTYDAKLDKAIDVCDFDMRDALKAGEMEPVKSEIARSACEAQVAIVSVERKEQLEIYENAINELDQRIAALKKELKK